PQISTLSLHDALPIFLDESRSGELVSRIMSDTNEVESILTDDMPALGSDFIMVAGASGLLFFANQKIALTIVPFIIGMVIVVNRSEEHTSELQSPDHL